MRYKYILTAFMIMTINAVQAENKATAVAYCPAPGQFINTLPACSADADSVAVAAQAQKNIDRGSLVSLGGFGGYIIFRFDKPVVNQPEQYDLLILGNASSNSAEPGIIAVCRDDNNNGLPDDEWYEIYGSEHANSTFHYSITYHKPSAENDAATGIVEQYIRWEDNQGGQGWLAKNSFHEQSYYPEWIKSETMTFSGTRLPDNAKYEDNIYKLHPFEWGYADNHPNKDEEKCSVKIDWAMDKDGNPANLTEINFVKIYTGQNVVRGGGSSIGESSPEISAVIDLHSVGTEITMPSTDTDICCHLSGTTLHFTQALTEQGSIYSITGIKLLSVPAGTKSIDLNHIANGIYIVRFADKTVKFVK